MYWMPFPSFQFTYYSKQVRHHPCGSPGSITELITDVGCEHLPNSWPEPWKRVKSQENNFYKYSHKSCNTWITRRMNLQVTKKQQFGICKIGHADKDKEKPPVGTGETAMNCWWNPSPTHPHIRSTIQQVTPTSTISLSQKSSFSLIAGINSLLTRVTSMLS